MNIHIGDIVTRPSYKRDLLFRVISVAKDEKGELYATLYGEDVRLVADAPFSDLEIVSRLECEERLKREQRLLEQSLSLIQQDYRLVRQKNEYTATNGYSHPHRFFQIPGKVLHLDGDPNYLKKCLMLYEKIGIPVHGAHCLEKDMPHRIGELMDEVRPDLLVITGHDAYSKSKGKKNDLTAYRHSRHFVQTVHEARKKVPHRDQLVIFAGACQSHFESLIYAGANFASSPSRVNIHALDPVYIVARISFTPFTEDVNVWDVLKNTLTGDKGLGGIQTRGLLRTGMPYHPHEDE